MKKENHKKGNEMNNKDDALMRSWAEVALENQGHDLRRDAVARFILKNIDDPYEGIEVGSVCIVKFGDEERVALRGKTRWYLCENDEAFSDVTDVVEVVSELVPKSTPEPKLESTPEPEQPRPPQPGEAWLIEHEGERYEAIYWYSALYAHWSFVRNREGTVYIESHEATPVSRLAPKPTPEHPEFLETEEDYRNAPAGTVVAVDNCLPRVKDDAGCRMTDIPDWHIHAAVAEAVRLRRKIIALRDSYADPDDPGDDYGRGAEAAYQIVARDLARILEGEA